MEVKSPVQPPGAPTVPPMELGPGALAVQERARRFAEDVLMPLEEEAERRGGRLGKDVVGEVKRKAIQAGLAGGLHAREHGGQGWTRLEWALAEEQDRGPPHALPPDV